MDWSYICTQQYNRCLQADEDYFTQNVERLISTVPNEYHDEQFKEDLEGSKFKETVPEYAKFCGVAYGEPVLYEEDHTDPNARFKAVTNLLQRLNVFPKKVPRG